MSSLGGDPHAGDVADVGVAARAIEVGDVMAGVAGRVQDPHALDLLAAGERVTSLGSGTGATSPQSRSMFSSP